MTGLSASNSAAKAWCASAAPGAAEAPAASDAPEPASGRDVLLFLNRFTRWPKVPVSRAAAIAVAAAFGAVAGAVVAAGLSGRGETPDPVLALQESVRMLAVDLGRARAALGSSSLADELSAGAAALRVGVDGHALERLRHDRPGQPLAVALGVLTDLIGRGVPVPAASESVLKLARNGLADEQLVAFRRDVERDIGLGASPATAAILRRTDANVSLARDGTVLGAGANGTPIGGAKRRP